MWNKKTEIKAGHRNPYDKKVHRKVFDINLILFLFLFKNSWAKEILKFGVLAASLFSIVGNVPKTV